MRKNVIYCVPVEGEGILEFFFHAEKIIIFIISVIEKKRTSFFDMEKALRN